MVTLSEHLLQLPKRGGRYKLLLVTEQRHGILTTQKEQPLRIRYHLRNLMQLLLFGTAADVRVTVRTWQWEACWSRNESHTFC